MILISWFLDTLTSDKMHAMNQVMDYAAYEMLFPYLIHSIHQSKQINSESINEYNSFKMDYLPHHMELSQ